MFHHYMISIYSSKENQCVFWFVVQTRALMLWQSHWLCGQDVTLKNSSPVTKNHVFQSFFSSVCLDLFFVLWDKFYTSILCTKNQHWLCWKQMWLSYFIFYGTAFSMRAIKRKREKIIMRWFLNPDWFLLFFSSVLKVHINVHVHHKVCRSLPSTRQCDDICPFLMRGQWIFQWQATCYKHTFKTVLPHERDLTTFYH